MGEGVDGAVLPQPALRFELRPVVKVLLIGAQRVEVYHKNCLWTKDEKQLKHCELKNFQKSKKELVTVSLILLCIFAELHMLLY